MISTRKFALGYELAAVAAAFLSAMLPNGARSEEGQRPTCELRMFESVDARTLANGEIAIPIALGSRTGWFSIDTGNGITSITAETARQLALKTGYTPYGGRYLNNIAISDYATLNSLAIGRLHSSGTMDVLVVPNSVVPPTIAGLIGTEIMSNYDIEFDFYRGKMNFFQHSDCRSGVYWTKANYAEVPIKLDRDRHIVLDATLDGKPITAILDTGSIASYMSLDNAREWFGWNKDDPRLKLARHSSINGGVSTPVYTFPFTSLTFEGIAISNPNIQLIPQASFDVRSHNTAKVILGMSVLRQLHLYIAFEQRKLFLTDAEAQ